MVSTLWISDSFARAISATEFSGIAYNRCSILNSSALIMANVNGNLRRNFVPWPCWVSSSTVPFSRCSTLRTTSSPTPRPEISVISSAVLKPGRKIKSSASAGDIRSASSALIRSTLIALALSLFASMPPPSSLTSTIK